MSRIVIVGGGQAGFTASTELRRQGWKGEVLLINDEAHLPYQRPPLSKAALTESHVDLSFAPRETFEKHNIDLRIGVSVVSIDRDRNAVSLSTSETVSYQHLILATGCTARRPYELQNGVQGLITLRTIKDAEKLRELLLGGARLGVVGGGFIGLEVASVARTLGLEVVLIEAQEHLMQRIVSRPIASYFERLHRGAGTHIETASTISNIITDDGRVVAVEMSGGKRIPTDLLLWACGAVPRDEVARDAGLDVDRGVVVDSHLLTSDPLISAIGDCAVHVIAETGQRLESVQNAVDQARYVAKRLTGHGEPYFSVPWFWSEQCGVRLQIAGVTRGHDETIVLGDSALDEFSVYCFTRGAFVGAESVGRPADHLAVRRILQSRVHLKPADVKAPGFTPASWLSEQALLSARS